MKKKSKLIIVDDIDDQGILAYRNKPSIDVYPNTKEIGFSDFSYSWEDIIAVGKKLEKMLVDAI
jgi:hypothetical protein|tara:strand:- start:328 stop:519 length:192 start_codon:yes stop_codon:yes gene_type:complete